MTFQQMYNLSSLLLDKAGSPYFTESEFDFFCNIAYNDWIEREYAKLETTHEHTSKLKALYKTFTKIGTEIILPTDISNFRYLIRINAEYNDSCLGEITRNVRKAQNDDIDVLKQDPFNRPTNLEPLYIQTESLGLPKLLVMPNALKVNITYIREPQKINSQTTPSVVFEMPDYIAEEIVQLCVKKQEVNIENYNRVQYEQNELIQRNGVFEQ